MRKSYRERNLFLKVALCTLRALPRYNLNSLQTHMRLLAGRFLSVVTKGEIQ